MCVCVCVCVYISFSKRTNPKAITAYIGVLYHIFKDHAKPYQMLLKSFPFIAEVFLSVKL